MNDTAQRITTLLQALQPLQLDIVDESHLHVGHAGNTGGGHYQLYIVSEAFTGLSLLQRHRLVYQTVAELMPAQIHALSIQAKTPAEAGS